MSKITGEIIAAIGIVVTDSDGSVVHQASEHLKGWESTDISTIEYHAMLRGLQLACKLHIRSLLLVNDNENAVGLMARHLSADADCMRKAIRTCVNTVEAIAIRRATKKEICEPHNAANRASVLRLAEIARKRERTSKTVNDDKTMAALSQMEAAKK